MAAPAPKAFAKLVLERLNINKTELGDRFLGGRGYPRANLVLKGKARISYEELWGMLEAVGWLTADEDAPIPKSPLESIAARVEELVAGQQEGMVVLRRELAAIQERLETPTAAPRKGSRR